MERSNGLSKCAGQSLELLRSSTFRQFATSLVRLRKSLFGCCPWIDIVSVVGDAECERAWDVSGSSFGSIPKAPARPGAFFYSRRQLFALAPVASTGTRTRGKSRVRI